MQRFRNSVSQLLWAQKIKNIRKVKIHYYIHFEITGVIYS